ncbi:MAG: AAA family ATPase [Pseudomonadota bacterium]
MSQKYRLFLSSPGDVATERNIVEQVIKRINAAHPDSGFELYRWEEETYTASKTFQAQIPTAAECDLMLCIFWKRLGSELPPAYKRPDGTTPTGSEYEFESAMTQAVSSPDQLPDIFVYRSEEPVTYTAENVDLERAQYNLLEAFWRRWFRNEQGHFIGAFDTYASHEIFEAKIESALLDWLSKRADGVEWTAGSPFRGLLPFEAVHAPVFFGRRREVSRARARLMVLGLAGHRFMLLSGASGSGKSSLVRAGLIPVLAKPGANDILPDQRLNITTSPALLAAAMAHTDWAKSLAEVLFADKELGESLKKGDFKTPEALAGLLKSSGPAALAPVASALNRIGDALSPARPVGLIILIDQMEEIFSWSSETANQFCATLAALATALPGMSGVTILATMRSEFRHRLPEIPNLGALARVDAIPGPDDPDPVLEIALPNAADIREMITGPATAAGLSYEPATETLPPLHDRIEAEAGPGTLPAMQYLLSKLYEKRDGTLLTHKAFEALGGVTGVMASQGEEIMKAGGSSQFPDLIRALVQTGTQGAPATARRVPAETFAADKGLKALAQKFVDAGLIMSDEQTMRLSHESLITGWDRLKRFVAGERRLFESRDRLAGISRLHSAGSAPLLDGFLLSEGQELQAKWSKTLLEEAHEGLPSFIAASEKAAKRKRNRRMAGLALAAVAVIGVALGFAYMQYQTALREAEFAKAQTEALNLSNRQLAIAESETHTINGERTAALEKAIEAYDLKATAKTTSLMMQKSLLLNSPGHLWTLTGSFKAMAFAPDGRLIAIDNDGVIAELSESGGKRLGQLALKHPPLAIEVLPDDKFVIVTRVGHVAWVSLDQSTNGLLDPVWLTQEDYNLGLRSPVAFDVGDDHFAVAWTDGRGRNPTKLLYCAELDPENCKKEALEEPAHEVAFQHNSLFELSKKYRLRQYSPKRISGESSRSPLISISSTRDLNFGTLSNTSLAAEDRFIAIANGRDSISAIQTDGKISGANFSDNFDLDGLLPENPNINTALSIHDLHDARLTFVATRELVAIRYLEPDALKGKTTLLRHYSSLVVKTAFAPNGQTLVFLHLDGSISLFNPFKQTSPNISVKRLPGQGVPVTAFAAFSEGKHEILHGDLNFKRSFQHVALDQTGHVAGISTFGRLLTWKRSDPSQKSNQSLPFKVHRVTFTMRNKYVAIGPTGIATENTTIKAEDRTTFGGVTADPTVESAVYFSDSNGALFRWDLTNLPTSAVPPKDSRDRSAGLSLSAHPNGRWLTSTRSDDQIRIYDLTGAQPPISLPIETRDSKVVDFSPDGSHLAALSSIGTLYLWRFDAEGGAAELVFAIDAAPDPVAFAPSDIRRSVWIDWMGPDHIGVATAHGDILVVSIDMADWRRRAEQTLPKPAFKN